MFSFRRKNNNSDEIDQKTLSDIRNQLRPTSVSNATSIPQGEVLQMPNQNISTPQQEFTPSGFDASAIENTSTSATSSSSLADSEEGQAYPSTGDVPYGKSTNYEMSLDSIVPTSTESSQAEADLDSYEIDDNDPDWAPYQEASNMQSQEATSNEYDLEDDDFVSTNTQYDYKKYETFEDLTSNQDADQISSSQVQAPISANDLNVAINRSPTAAGPKQNFEPFLINQDNTMNNNNHIPTPNETESRNNHNSLYQANNALASQVANTSYGELQAPSPLRTNYSNGPLNTNWPDSRQETKPNQANYQANNFAPSDPITNDFTPPSPQSESDSQDDLIAATRAAINKLSSAKMQHMQSLVNVESSSQQSIQQFAADILEREIKSWIKVNLPDVVNNLVQKKIDELMSK